MAKKWKSVTQTGAGSTGWIPMDYRCREGAKMVISCIKTGTVTDYTVQYTNDDVQDPAFIAGSANVFAHDTLVNLGASATGNIEFMPVAIRMTITTGTGSVEMQMIPSQ